MFQSTSLGIASTEGGAMRIVSCLSPGMSRFARHPPPTLTREARKRLSWMEHSDRSRNVSLTCRYFGISRPAFYRWKARYHPKELSSLEDKPGRPKRTRPKSWNVAEIEAVRRLR